MVGAGGYGRLHVLRRNPFERTMRVVLTAKQVWGRKAELGQAGAIGPAADDVIIGFESRRHEGLPRQLNRAHVLAQPVSHVAILFAELAATARPRFSVL